MKNYDIIIIGGGPAGLAAAAAAKEEGADSILILERDRELGGILNQCIHNGFGLHTFKEELTGPEYAARFITKVTQLGIEYKLNTMVIDISPEKQITAMNKEDGYFTLQAKTIILAMGCRERSRGALNIPGYRPAGVFTAGTAQYYVNIEGRMPGKEVVILGSGDIGLIMARRMTLEGAKVKMVVELMPYSGGLKRNIVQCLDDYGIPLKLSHTVIDIDGRERLKGVTVAKVDENRKPIPGTEEYIPCDTLLLSVGLIPENELSKNAGVTISPVTSGPVVDESLETNIDGIFACGNVLHVHDLVDYVSEEAAIAGRNAVRYLQQGHRKNQVQGSDALTDDEASAAEVKKHAITEVTKDSIIRLAEQTTDKNIEISAVNGVRYTVPQTLHPVAMDEIQTIRFRVDNVYQDSYICVYFDGKEVIRRKKRILTPGEMEEVRLKKKDLVTDSNLSRITIKIER